MENNAVTYEQAIDLCNRAGMRYLTYAKKVERGVDADETEVKHDMFLLYLEAAKSDLPRAHYNLGVCFHFGVGVGDAMGTTMSSRLWLGEKTLKASATERRIRQMRSLFAFVSAT